MRICPISKLFLLLFWQKPTVTTPISYTCTYTYTRDREKVSHEAGQMQLSSCKYCLLCVWFLKGWPISWWPAVHLHFWHRIYNCLEKIERERAVSMRVCNIRTYYKGRNHLLVVLLIIRGKNWNSQLEMDMDFRNPVVLYFTL